MVRTAPEASPFSLVTTFKGVFFTFSNVLLHCKSCSTPMHFLQIYFQHMHCQSQALLLRALSENMIFSKNVGGLQITSANHKSTNLWTNIFYDLWTFCKCDNLWICDLLTIFFVICGFAICESSSFLQTENFCKYIILFLTNISLKCSHSNLVRHKNLGRFLDFGTVFVTEIHGLSQFKIYIHR